MNRIHPPLPDGLCWRGDTIHIHTSVGGRRISRSCRTASVPEARRLLETIRSQVRVAELTGVKAPVFEERVALAVFVADEIAQMRVDGASAKTLVKYTGVMEAFGSFLQQKLGREPWIHEVTHALVVSFKTHAGSTLRRRNGSKAGLGRLASSRTVANELDVVRIFLRKAVQKELLKENPETGVTRPKGAYDARIRWLDDDQIERLLTAARTWDDWAHVRGQPVGDLYALVLEMYLRTGLRLNELRFLTLVHCARQDPSGRRVLHIGPHPGHTTFCCPADDAVAAKLRKSGREKLPKSLMPPEVPDTAFRSLTYLPDLQTAIVPVSCGWKPKSRPRDVPLSHRGAWLLDQLLERRRHLLRRKPSFEQARAHVKAAEPPWLVPDPSGVPWRFSLQYIMDKCSTQAGITPIVRTHDLRHTFATQLRRRNVPIETIKELLGHADIAETLVYAHFTLTEAVRSIDLIDEVATSKSSPDAMPKEPVAGT